MCNLTNSKKAIDCQVSTNHFTPPTCNLSELMQLANDLIWMTHWQLFSQFEFSPMLWWGLTMFVQKLMRAVLLIHSLPNRSISSLFAPWLWKINQITNTTAESMSSGNIFQSIHSTFSLKTNNELRKIHWEFLNIFRISRKCYILGCHRRIWSIIS